MVEYNFKIIEVTSNNIASINSYLMGLMIVLSSFHFEVWISFKMLSVKHSI